MIDRFNSLKNSHRKLKLQEENFYFIEEFSKIVSLESAKSQDFLRKAIIDNSAEKLLDTLEQFAENIYNFSNNDLEKLSDIFEERLNVISRNNENSLFLKTSLKYNLNEFSLWEGLHNKLSSKNQSLMHPMIFLFKEFTQEIKN